MERALVEKLIRRRARGKAMQLPEYSGKHREDVWLPPLPLGEELETMFDHMRLGARGTTDGYWHRLLFGARERSEGRGRRSASGGGRGRGGKGGGKGF